MLEDIAIDPAAVVSEDLGIKIDKVHARMLGHAKKVRIDKDNTTIIDGAGKEGRHPGARCAQLRKQIETVTSEYDGELQERLAKLSGGVAIMGGGTEIEIKERKDKGRGCDAPTARPSRKASWPAAASRLRRKGLIRCAPTPAGQHRHRRRALQAPAARSTLRRRRRRRRRATSWATPRPGLRRPDRRLFDMMKAGIIDPAKVDNMALQGAASIAKGLLIHRNADRRRSTRSGHEMSG